MSDSVSEKSEKAVAETASRRERLLQAVEHGDLELIQTEGERGFDDAALRRAVWPLLLHVRKDETSEISDSGLRKRKRTAEDSDEPEASQAATEHPDESQVELDVKRSFVGLLDGATSEEKVRRRQELEHVIVSVLRRHPSLHYFQGFHDIVSIVLLALDDVDLTLACVERMALHRIRDSMSTGLDPVIALLRLMKRILKLADPAFARVVDQASALPYFSLSWVLTLLAHDIASVDTAARVFDLLLTQNPVFVCYLAVAIVLAKKDEIAALDSDDAEDPSMLHATFAKVPRLRSSSPTPAPDTHEKARTEDSWTAASSLLDSDVWTPAFVEPEVKPEPDKPTSPADVPIEPILRAALDLYRRFPMDHKSIAVDELLGSCSCVFTWSLKGESPPALSDEEAERVAKEGGLLIVKPPPLDEDPEAAIEAERKRRAAKLKREREVARRAVAQMAFAFIGLAGVLLAVYAPDLPYVSFLRSFATTVLHKFDSL